MVGVKLEAMISSCTNMALKRSYFKSPWGQACPGETSTLLPLLLACHRISASSQNGAKSRRVLGPHQRPSSLRSKGWPLKQIQFDTARIPTTVACTNNFFSPFRSLILRGGHFRRQISRAAAHSTT